MTTKPVLGSFGYGDQMRAARQAKGWTQAQLGERLGISKQYVHDLEYERREPGERVAIALSKCLDVQWYSVNHMLRERVAELEMALQRLVAVTGELSYRQVGDALWTEFVEARTEAKGIAR